MNLKNMKTKVHVSWQYRCMIANIQEHRINPMADTFTVESVTLLESKVKRYANISIRSLINQQRNIEYSFGCS